MRAVPLLTLGGGVPQGGLYREIAVLFSILWIGLWRTFGAAGSVDVIWGGGALRRARTCWRCSLRVPIPMPHLAGLRAEQAAIADDAVHIDLHRTARTGRCPGCRWPSVRGQVKVPSGGHEKSPPLD